MDFFSLLFLIGQTSIALAISMVCGDVKHTIFFASISIVSAVICVAHDIMLELKNIKNNLKNKE
jgi:hypothetical protein